MKRHFQSYYACFSHTPTEISGLHRMKATCYFKADLNTSVEVSEIDEPGFIIPRSDSWGDAPEGSDRSAMIELASAQTRFVKQVSPVTPVGGHLLVIELFRGGLTFSSLSDLPSKYAEIAVS